MSSSQPQSMPFPKAVRSESERLPWGWITAAALVVVGLPVSMALTESWVATSGASAARRAPPEWLATQTVRATSGNGEVVKARVALDVPDQDTRDFLNRQSEQVKLLMQIGVSEFERDDGSGEDDVKRLAAELRSRLNDYLAASRVPPVRRLVIQDLLFGKP